ncbi:AMP-binding protein [Pseudonocardia xinjiangensis]|uniref:AMP-binding protein n=1 Tax=Pseudonocardia xinjiangensis TaxID=75289 RepID=A0ABX1RN37_9PSEU|nr:AMP-binding protein [Pseudonocardia xinjiangensis]NMH80525.1 AMP-binding protein [Pseudonocardia xinjiangensis]
MSVFEIRPSDAASQHYRAAGIWRGSGPIGDLRRWRHQSPDTIAIRAYQGGSTPAEMSSVMLTYAEYAHYVERFAGALYELGVRPGDVVGMRPPNGWRVGPLLLAANRLQAVLAPIMTTIGARELERVLDRVGASVYITIDEWAGVDHATALREMAPRLSQLRHRVVLGRAADGEIDFSSFFENTPWEQRHPIALDDAEEDPDRAAILFFTSGTTGEPKGAIHTNNTFHVGVSGMAETERVGPQDVTFSPHAQMFGMGYLFTLLPLLTGACGVVLDSWSGERGARLLAEAGVSIMFTGPTFIQDMIAARDGQPQTPLALRTLCGGGTTLPRPLIAEVPRVFGVPLQVAWGMTEVGLGTMTQKDDPVDWAAHSDGRACVPLDLDVRPDSSSTHDQPGRLFARGGGVCLATYGRDSGKLVVIAEQDDGWYDTGDLAIPDGRGGIRLMGRASDRIGGLFMIPVADVESALLCHPGVADVALVGYPVDDGDEQACAVITPATEPPVSLDGLRRYLSDQEMTEWYIPTPPGVCHDNAAQCQWKGPQKRPSPLGNGRRQAHKSLTDDRGVPVSCLRAGPAIGLRARRTESTGWTAGMEPAGPLSASRRYWACRHCDTTWLAPSDRVRATHEPAAPHRSVPAARPTKTVMDVTSPCRTRSCERGIRR